MEKTERNKTVQNLLNKLAEQLPVGFYYFYLYPDGDINFVKKTILKKDLKNTV